MSMVMEEGQGQGQGSNSQSQNCNDVVVEHDGTNDISIEEEELALVALVEHRTREFKKIRFFVSHYTTQVHYIPPSFFSLSFFLSSFLSFV